MYSSGSPRSTEEKFAEMHYFFDSSFPVGYFSHSFGFESEVVNFSRVGLEGCRQWILTYLVYSIWYSELEALNQTRDLYRGSGTSGLSDIEKVDQVLFSSRSTSEARRAARMIACATKRASEVLFGDGVSELSSLDLSEPAVVVGVISEMRKWNPVLTGLLYMQSHALALTQVILRYAKIGQKDQMLIMADLMPKINALALERPRAGSVTVAKTCMKIDMDQMRHETLTPRLFQS